MHEKNCNKNISETNKLNFYENKDLNFLLTDKLTIKELASIIEFNNLLPELLNIVNTEKSSIKYTCCKITRYISEKNPQILYPYYFIISSWLNNENNFIKWDAIYIISNLASVDKDNNFSKIYDKYFNFINCGQMITAANIVENSWKFVIANPTLDADITFKLLNIPNIIYFNKNQISSECNKIVCGKVIESFDKYFNNSCYQDLMIDFVEKQLSSTRKSIVKLAKRFLEEKRINKKQTYYSYIMEYKGGPVHSNFYLRRYDDYDYDWYRATCNQCFKALREKLGIYSMLCEDKNVLLKSKEHIFIFEENTKKIGSVSIYGNEIDDLFVDPEYQGKGYGKKLVLFAISKIQNEKNYLGPVFLQVLHINRKAIKLYQDCGFQITKKIQIK